MTALPRHITDYFTQERNLKTSKFIFFVAVLILIFGLFFNVILSAQEYSPHYNQPESYQQHNYQHLEQQRELQEDFLHGQRQNMLMERDFRQWDYEKRQREWEEKYN